MTKTHFRLLFVLIPVLAACPVPLLVSDLLTGELGSNIIWGNYFGVGWCLAASWTGSLARNREAATLGLLWSWLALIPLWILSGWLWARVSQTGHKIVIGVVLGSAALILPASMIGDLEEDGVHLPDFTSHMMALD